MVLPFLGYLLIELTKVAQLLKKSPNLVTLVKSQLQRVNSVGLKKKSLLTNALAYLAASFITFVSLPLLVNVAKYFYVAYEVASKRARLAQVPAKPFQPSLMFASEAAVCLSETPIGIEHKILSKWPVQCFMIAIYNRNL
jgi:hypothetical protein